MRGWIILVFLVAAGTAVRAASLAEIAQWEQDGHWQQARTEIARELAATNVNFSEREKLLFLQDRLHRMSMDFSLSREQAFRQAQSAAPNLSWEQFANWEKSGSVEFLNVDGTNRYFRQAGKNLFLINPAAASLLTKAERDAVFGDPNYRLSDIHEVLANYDKTGQVLTTPKTWRVTYQITVAPDAVPAGETLRAWLPFPHTLNRQSDIRLLATDPPQHILADPRASLSSVYLEKTARSGQPTSFQVSFECTCRAFYQPIDPARVTAIDTNNPALAPWLAERPSQMIFSDDVKKLAHDIVGDETNSYLKARLIFQWVFEHIPWASAREYCTLDCLPQYALAHGHGDCGMEAMTFMTLCRCSGIPARWESGWVAQPYQDMHDWCEIYLAPYGWVPVDVCYGLVDSNVEREKWFYLGGIDDLRMVINTDFEQPVYPAKTHFRSEVVDFQRGEVEWRGGNLYYDQWSFNYQAEEVPAGK